MKKFILITVGFTQPTPEIMEAWSKWFQSIQDKIVEQVGLRNGVEVTTTEVRPLPMDAQALTGYIVIQVRDQSEAIQIAQKCPMITSTLVYEWQPAPVAHSEE